MGFFLPFYPYNSPKKWKFQRTKKIPGDVIILHKFTKIMMIWYTVPEIWHVTDVIVIFHFGLFFALLPKKWKFQKMKKTPGDIIILHKCIKNHDHMLYCSWDMTCDRCNCYFSFWANFCPFTPLTAQKIKISKKEKKEKKAWRCHHFRHVYQKIIIR